MYRHVGYILLYVIALSRPAFATRCQPAPSSIDSSPGACTEHSGAVFTNNSGGTFVSCRPLPICIPAVWYVTLTASIPTSLPDMPDITSVIDVDDDFSGSGASPPKPRPPRAPRPSQPISYGSSFRMYHTMVIQSILFNSTYNSPPQYSGSWNNASDTRDRVNQSLGIIFHENDGTISLSGESRFPSIKSVDISCKIIVCISPRLTPPPSESNESYATPQPPSRFRESQATPSITTRKDVTISKIYSSTTAASTTSSITSSHVTSRTTSHAIAPSTTTSHTEDEIVHTAIDEEEFVFLHSGHISINSDSNVLLIVAISLLCVYIFI
ncbi:m15 [Muromegalovirus WP15B]|uniref:M15 n=1 Tax=Muromegalovirus WP15B TaxID=524651 RepID=B3UXE2_MUHV1|nr:m15 [Muromegalovirus WP15B]